MQALIAELLDELGVELAPDAPLDVDAYGQLPEVVVACLLRLHLFNQQLYQHRTDIDLLSG